MASAWPRAWCASATTARVHAEGVLNRALGRRLRPAHLGGRREERRLGHQHHRRQEESAGAHLGHAHRRALVADRRHQRRPELGARGPERAPAPDLGRWPPRTAPMARPGSIRAMSSFQRRRRGQGVAPVQRNEPAHRAELGTRSSDLDHRLAPLQLGQPRGQRRHRQPRHVPGTGNFEKSTTFEQEFRLNGRSQAGRLARGSELREGAFGAASRVDTNTTTLDPVLYQMLNGEGAGPAGAAIRAADGVGQGAGIPGFDLLGQDWKEGIQNTLSAHSEALMGDIIWHLGDATNLTTGVRFTQDTKKFSWYNPLRSAPGLDAQLAMLTPDVLPAARGRRRDGPGDRRPRSAARAGPAADQHRVRQSRVGGRAGLHQQDLAQHQPAPGGRPPAHARHDGLRLGDARLPGRRLQLGQHAGQRRALRSRDDHQLRAGRQGAHRRAPASPTARRCSTTCSRTCSRSRSTRARRCPSTW